MTSKWYDEENNFKTPPGEEDHTSRIIRLRLGLASEFMRCKAYHPSVAIDQALDDADTALGFLMRTGYIEEWDI